MPSHPRPFSHPHRVPYSDCTLGNHVYYARYLDLLETARGEFFRALGRPLLELQNQGLIFPVIECVIRYKAPARYDDLLEVKTWVQRVDRIKLVFAYAIHRQGAGLLVEAETTHICASLQEKPARLPSDLVELLAAQVLGAE